MHEHPMERLHGTGRMAFAAVIDEDIGAPLFLDGLRNKPDRGRAHVGERTNQLVVGFIGFHGVVIFLVARRQQTQHGERGGELLPELCVLLFQRRHGVEMVVDVTGAVGCEDTVILGTDDRGVSHLNGISVPSGQAA